jgi:hypothetical protein
LTALRLHLIPRGLYLIFELVISLLIESEGCGDLTFLVIVHVNKANCSINTSSIKGHLYIYSSFLSTTNDRLAGTL